MWWAYILICRTNVIFEMLFLTLLHSFSGIWKLHGWLQVWVDTVHVIVTWYCWQWRLWPPPTAQLRSRTHLLGLLLCCPQETLRKCGWKGEQHTRQLHGPNPETVELVEYETSQIARFRGPTLGPSGADRTQVGPMLVPWTLLSEITSKIIQLVGITRLFV